MQSIKIANSYDEEQVRRGLSTVDQVRTAEVDAVVSSRATMLVLPEDLVSRLGLRLQGFRRVRYADGHVAELPWVAGIRITVLGRDAIVNGLVEAADTTPIIGHIPLTALDLHVDPASGELRGTPDSPDEPIYDAFSAA
jgi:predicted aspartyl protease